MLFRSLQGVLEALHLHHLLGDRRLVPARLVFRRAAGAHWEIGLRVRHHELVPRPALVGVAEFEVGVDAPLVQREGGLLTFLSAITRYGGVTSNDAKNVVLVCLNIYRKISKRTYIPL